MSALLLTSAAVVVSMIPACSSTGTPSAAPGTASTTSTTTPPPTFEQGSAAAVADCEADAKNVEVAVEAFMAVRGSFPAPPAPWSAANYVADFAPLTAGSEGGPFLRSPPSTANYVVEYDSAGQVWVAPPGNYGTAYNPAQDLDSNPDVCLAAVR